jgi:hypothetical protein
VAGRVSVLELFEAAVQVARSVVDARRYGGALLGPRGVASSPGGDVEEVMGGVFRVLAHVPGGGLRGLVWSGPFPVGGFCCVYGVDASSRRLEGSLVRVYSYAGAVSYFDGGVAVGSYPDVGLYPYVDSGGPAAAIAAPFQPPSSPRWLASSPPVDPEAVARLIPGVGLRVGGGYWGSYDPRVMAEENREVLENMLLSWVTGRAQPGSLAAVDGTVYMTPGLLTHIDALQRAALRGSVTPSTILRLAYALSYLASTAVRAELVSRAAKRGVGVVGVVKRVHSSRLLVNALESSGYSVPVSYDVELVEHLASKTLRGYGYAAVGPVVALVDFAQAARRLDSICGGVASNLAASQPLSSRRDYPQLASLARLYGELLRLGFRGKRMYYVYIRLPGTPATVYRVEVPEQGELVTVDEAGSYKLNTRAASSIVEEDLGIVGLLVEQLTRPEPGSPMLPLPVQAADTASKRASSIVAGVWFKALAPVETFDYETLASSGVLGVAW